MRELSLNNCRLDRRYDTREELGRGSYAEIYLARDIMASPQSPHSTVVIKALNVFLQDDLDADLERTLVENFQNEAIALDRVRHPNIISRIGHGTARDLRGTVFHYLVLEYMMGGDMQTVLRRRQVPLAQAMNYIEQVCAGLGHAHTRGIIHRDIKPQNLLLSGDQTTVKIADFGVARISAADSPITRVGTNIYAPPEHSPLSAGRTGDLGIERLTPAADIYSLAKTIYTILTGEPPRAFANETIFELPEKCRDEQWADELLRVLTRATASDPRQRQQTVEELWADLSEIREIAGDGEFSTVVRSKVDTPQPHVLRGYTPIAPAQPSFERLVINSPAIPDRPIYARPTFDPRRTQPISLAAVAAPGGSSSAPIAAANVRNDVVIPSTEVSARIQPPIKKRRFLRRVITFLIVVGLFTGALFGTASYIRSLNVWKQVTSPFTQPTAVASTDIYLRSQPNTDNDPIGLVTKNSRVRIVNSQNNWYQVDIVEQGRVSPTQTNAKRGWLNGKYLDLSDN